LELRLEQFLVRVEGAFEAASAADKRVALVAGIEVPAVGNTRVAVEAEEAARRSWVERVVLLVARWRLGRLRKLRRI
jgi:hypothetical protein